MAADAAPSGRRDSTSTYHPTSRCEKSVVLDKLPQMRERRTPESSSVFNWELWIWIYGGNEDGLSVCWSTQLQFPGNSRQDLSHKPFLVNQKLHPLLVLTFGNKYVDKYVLFNANDSSLLNTSARVTQISMKLFLQLQF